MTLNRLYDNLVKVSFKSLDKQIVEMLRDTWAKLATELNLDEQLTKSYFTVDDARMLVYSNIKMWESTHLSKHAKVLNEWMDLNYEKQNELLIKAFPDGRRY